MVAHHTERLVGGGAAVAAFGMRVFGCLIVEAWQENCPIRTVLVS